jgi:hypothetical protein
MAAEHSSSTTPTPPPLATTPDFALIRLREHCQRILTNSRAFGAAALMAAQMFMSLDAALCEDGVLPLDWTDARRSLVLNGMPKQPTWSGFHVPDAYADADEDPEDVIEV